MVEEFKSFLIGSFNNRRQAFSFPAQYSQISLKHVLLDNGMLYGEQWYTVRKQPPYRQFVLEVSQDGAEKFYITSSTLTINDSTFSAARDGKYNFGSLSVDDPVMSTASSVLYLQLNSAAALTAEYTVKFRGMVAFDV